MAFAIVAMYLYDLFDEEDEEVEEGEEVEKEAMTINRQELNLMRRGLRGTTDPFAMEEEQFKRTFHLSRNVARFLVKKLTPHLGEAKRITRTPVVHTILCALQFYANGSYQRSVGNSMIAMSQSMVSRSVNLVTELITLHLRSWMQFPSRGVDIKSAKDGFMHLGLSQIIGALGGTHVSIVKPQIRPENYVNRNSYHSLNIQIVCDADLRISNLNSNFAGRCHDSYVYRKSLLDTKLRTNYSNGIRDNYIICDSGYPFRPWLLTPCPNPLHGTPEARFNEKINPARSIVEKCIGLLKGRFRCLLKDKKLHYNPNTASKIILACALLHNIILKIDGLQDILVELDDIDKDPIRPELANLRNLEFQQEAQDSRRSYINRFFLN